MRLIDQRLGLIFCFFLLLFSVALARAAWLQGVKAGEVPGQRGRVLDRNGKVLAVSETAATIVATPYQLPDIAETSRRLATALPMTSSEIEEAIGDPES